MFCRFSATLTIRRSLLFNSKILNINVVSSSLELNLVPEARDLGSSGIQGSRVSPGGGSGVQDAGAGPPECRLRTAEGTGNQHWGAHGPGILECDSGVGALEPPSWAGSPGVRGSGAAVQRPGDSRAQEAIPGGRAVRRGRLQARPTGLRVEQGPRGQATALTWSAPPSVVQGGPRELSYPNESLGRVGNAPGNTRPPPLPPGRRSAARPLPPGAPPSSRWLPWVRLLQAGPVGPPSLPKSPVR